MPLLLAGGVSSAQAQTWDGSESTDWFAGDNWDTGTVPDGTADVIINTVLPNPTEVTNGTAVGRDLFVGRSNTGELNISNGGSLINRNTFISDNISGSGSATVSGTGSTWTHTGNLQVGFRGNGDLTVSGGAQVQNVRGFVGNQAGSVGVVVITGSGSTWSNTSDLVLGNDGSGTVTVTNGGNLQVTNGIALGNRAGNGTLNIGAAAGSAAAAAGTVSAGSIQFGNGTGTLVFNHLDTSGTYQFSNDITSNGTGSHTINHLAGWTDYTGDGSGFTGTTNITGGTLAVNGSLGGTGSQTIVGSGATLAGTGTLGGVVQVQSGGGVAPGNNSIGSMNVADLSFAAGSTFFVDIDAAGNSDQMLSSGATGVTINGGTVAVSGTPGVGTTYTIITATNGVTGTFDNLTGLTNTLFVTYLLDYDANNVYITSNQTTSFCDLAGSPNQRAVACDGLASLPLSNDIVDAILALGTPGEVRAAYDALSGEIHSSTKGALMVNGQHRVNAVNNRIHNGIDDSATQSTVAAFGGLSSLADGNNGAWITGYGSWGDTDGNGNTFQMDNDLGGVVFGIDREYSQRWRFGVLGGYSQTDVTQDALASSSSVDTWSLGLYGGAEAGANVFSFGAIYNWHDIDTARSVSFPGVNQALSARYDAQSWQLFAEAGHKVQLNNIALEPFAGLSYIHLDTDSYTETGGSAALSAPSISNDATFTTLGIRAAANITDKVKTRGMIGWRHAFGDTDAASTFTLAGSNPFTVTGAPIAEDAFVTELGLEANMSDNASIGASYNGQFGDGTTTHGFNASLQVKF